jgi:sugar lactone lactonase YvrE
MTKRTRVLVEGLAFPEGPRWHDGRLWFSDQHDGRVLTVDAAGTLTEIARVPTQPSGLGFAPDGTLWIVSMADQRVLRLRDGALELVADLSALVRFHCNDMVIDAQGRAYVGNFGFDLDHGGTPALTHLVMVTPDGQARVVADGLAFPNGSVITPDARTLIVGETFGGCLTAFDIAGDGSLSRKRVWASLDSGASADGICLDAEGAIWVASPSTSEVIRVHEGGEVSERIAVSTRAFACMLGGADRRTLHICTAETFKPQQTVVRRSGRIEVVEVAIPGAGRP